MRLRWFRDPASYGDRYAEWFLGVADDDSDPVAVVAPEWGPTVRMSAPPTRWVVIVRSQRVAEARGVREGKKIAEAWLGAQ